MSKKIQFASIICCLIAINSMSQTPVGKTSKWQVDDIIMSEAAIQPDISPDGKWVVWVKSTPDKEKDGRVTNLILSSLTEKKEIELTRGSEWNNTSPKWSPDGRLIAFVSTRPVPKGKGETPSAAPSGPSGPAGDGPKPQLWLFNPQGGEPWNLTSLERGAVNFEWLDDNTIVFIAPEDPTNYEKTVKEKKDASVVVEDAENTPPVRLFSFSIKDKKTTRLSGNNDWIESFALSRDRTKVIAIHNRSLRYVYDQKIKPAVFLHDLKTGEQRQLFGDAKLNVVAVHEARDADGFYVVAAYTTDPEYVNASINLVYFYDTARNSLTQVDLGWENGINGTIEATNDGFLALMANGARHKFARFVREGAVWNRTWIEGELAASAFEALAGRDGKTLLILHSTGSVPLQWYKTTLNGGKLDDLMQVTDINQHFKQREKARSEVVRWKGSNNDEVEGILFYPHNYEPGRKYPLMLMIHGGPFGADFDMWEESWAYPTNLICERGAFVLKPNYHGSSNYGLKFGESISRGKYYDLEVPDIEKGVDYLISRGLVDPDKLGTMGWSNGSILSIALTVNSTRYKVCGAGAGDVEWISDWGNAHFGASFDNYYLGKSPLEDPLLYIRKSPFYRMDKVTTPTIIFFGTQDTNVPTQQGWLHYRALQQLGKTDVRFILFPGEPHGLQKLTHQKRKVEEELAWFDKHFFKTSKEENKSLRADSPLAMVLKQAAFKKAGLFFGESINGKLAPETVKYGSLKFEIGRFEVTRAQFVAFDPAYKFEPGTENHPANNISFRQATEYCEWLSRQTGRQYRLAAAEDVQELYALAGAGENTLDYWAGYQVNPDDAERLQAKLREIGGPAPLLKQVGSFKPLGDDPIFDIGGNVAEWVIGKNGAGVITGGSADQPFDEKRAGRTPAPAYIGFRVVKQL